MHEVAVEPALPSSNVSPRVSPAVARLSFALLWLSETAFDLGTTLASFAIGVWIFAQTGSSQDYSFSVLAAAAAGMLMTPFAGAFADRHDRRWVVLGCDVAAILCTFAVVLGLLGERLGVEALYLYAALSAALAAVRRPAIRVAISSFVPKERFTQVGGLTGVSRAIVQVGAPAASGFLMGHFGLQSVLAVQLCLLTAGALLVFSALNRAGGTARGGALATPADSFWNGARSSFSGAWSYLREQPLMQLLLLYGALVQCLMVLATTLLTPLVLSTHSTDVLGLVMSVGIVGGLAGSMLVATRLIRRRLMRWVLLFDVLQCAAVLVAGLTTSTLIWCLAAFACLLGGSTSVACSCALWMRKAPLEHQGSVFALLGASNLLVMCLVLLAGGYLADQVLEPALLEGGALSASVGSWFGTGKGRGIGLLFFLSGAVGLLLTLAALASPRLRQLDLLVPERAEA
ncbi:MAG: MFS transporter [Pseudomonas sp.]|uniref:MFS transporter n=1 Tax=Pseudomonas sp. TaxID=306 RepID=UPI00339088B1